MLKELFNYGKYFLIGNLGGLLFINTDTLMLMYFQGAGAVGLYNVAIPLATLIIATGSIFMSIVVPVSSELYAQQKIESLKQGILRINQYSVMILMPIIGIIVLFPKELILLGFGSAYLDAARSMQILASGALIFVLSSINFSILAGIGRADQQAKIYLGIALINIVLNIVLITRYGLVGAAMATAAAYCLSLWLSIRALKKVIPFNLPYSQWFRVIVAVALSGALVNFCRTVIPWNNLLEIGVLGTLFFIAYGTLLVVLKVITKEDITYMKSYL
jgi:O-antigen/teichoic acid export membrane protein